MNLRDIIKRLKEKWNCSLIWETYTREQQCLKIQEEPLT